MIAGMLVLLMVLVLVSALAIVSAIEHHTQRVLNELERVGTPEAPLSAHGGTFTQLMSARVKAQAQTNVRGEAD